MSTVSASSLQYYKFYKGNAGLWVPVLHLVGSTYEVYVTQTEYDSLRLENFPRVFGDKISPDGLLDGLEPNFSL